MMPNLVNILTKLVYDFHKQIIISKFQSLFINSDRHKFFHINNKIPINRDEY